MHSSVLGVQPDFGNIRAGGTSRHALVRCVVGVPWYDVYLQANYCCSGPIGSPWSPVAVVACSVLVHGQRVVGHVHPWQMDDSLCW